jgi:hypothetical protein
MPSEGRKMLNSVLRIALACACLAATCGSGLAAGSRGGHGSHGGGGHSHGGGFHGGGSRGGGHFRSGGGFHGGGGLFHGGSRGSGFSGRGFSGARGGLFGSSRRGFGGTRGGFSGSSRGFSTSRGFSSQTYSSRAFANSGGSGWTSLSRSQSSRMTSPGFSSRNPWGQWSPPARASSSFDAYRPGGNHSAPLRNFSRGGSAWNNAASRSAGRSNGYDSNRPPWSQSPSMGRGLQSAPGWTRASAQRASFAANRSLEVNRPPSTQPRSANASPARVSGPTNTLRHVDFANSNRPPTSRAATLGSLSGRGNSSWSNTSYFVANHGRSNSGGSRFPGSSFTNGQSSFSRSSSFGGAGSRSFGFSRAGFRRDGFGRGRYGYGRFGHRGYGYGGWGGDPWSSGADFWFLGDLFGLALDLGRFAVWPTWGLAGLNLLDSGLQALDSSGGDSYGNDYGGAYNGGQYYTNQAPPYPALCGTYYSDENPGCQREY